MSDFNRVFWVIFLDLNTLVYEIVSVSIDFWIFNEMFSNLENSILNERFFGIWFDIEWFFTPILFDRVVFFLTFLKLFFFISLIERRWRGLRKRIKSQKILFFFSLFLSSGPEFKRKKEKENLFFIKKQCLRL